MKLLFKISSAFILLAVALSSCKDCNQCEVYRVDTAESIDTLSYIYPAICGLKKDLNAYEDRCLVEWEDTDTTDTEYYRCVCDELE